MISPAVATTIKHVGGFLVSSGVSTMVGYAAKQSVPKVAPISIRHIPVLAKSWKVFQKVAIPAGAAALAGMASEHAVKYSDKKIDETVVELDSMKAMLDDLVTKSKNKKNDDKDSE